MKSVLVLYRDRPEASPYAEALRLAGLEPHLAEAGPNVRLNNFSGLLLTGGTDVDPALYGEAALGETDNPDAERDQVERRLIDEALRTGRPLLAICRGLQLLNVHLGGTLWQHLATADRHVRRTPDRGQPAHEVAIRPGTLLSHIAGRETWQVNSRHHQAVRDLGRGLRISAVDPEDGVIEALEVGDHPFALALQWHPENQALQDSEQRRIFECFGAGLRVANSDR